MDIKSDRIISSLTVRLKDSESGKYIGTGVIYYADALRDKVYIITASHCLFRDRDGFQDQRTKLIIDVLDSGQKNYKSIIVLVNPNLLFKEKEKDIAILIVDKREIESVLGKIPKIKVIKEKSTHKQFITKGFPQATFGEEIAVLYPDWLQAIDYRFQLQLKEDYLEYNTEGFSGSGIFLLAENEFFLYGIFTRFRGEEKGKVIYCQFIDNINELLSKNFIPLIGFEYFGNHGLTKNFFSSQVENAIVGLGPRFSKELNFKLPIAKSFNDLAKDVFFKKRLFKFFDEWISSSDYTSTANKHLEQIENELSEIKIQTTEWIQNLNLSIESKIDIEWLSDKLERINEKAEQKSNELYELRRQEEKLKANTQKKHHEQYPYESELGRLRRIRNQNQDFIFEITEKINVDLANNPYLIIKGDAGNGKSHLLGDIAKKRIESNLPTLLLLGQNFDSHKNIWDNIKSELNLHCSNNELLSELNSIGKQIGSRVLILIDAINEGGGFDLWYTRIGSFINEFLNYPYIGLTLSIRSTYIDYVIPAYVLKNPKISILDHEGFKGNEYAALKLFCEFHGLKQPHFPIMTPEFSKPLFLKMISEAIKETEEKTFPQGFQGISAIFQLYIKSLNLKFERRREDYKNRNIVEKAIYLLADECFKLEERVLTLEEALSLFDNTFPLFRNLINDLIEENVFIRKIRKNYETGKNEEVIYFAYERFGDFFIANDILSKFETKADLKKSFEKEGELGKFLGDDFWRYDGVLEAFAVLLPEKFALEIYEVFDWIYMDETVQEYKREENENKISRFFLDSLNWREIGSIEDSKIIDWFKSGKDKIGDDEYFLKLYELASIKNHPFNSDRLYNILNRIEMPERDSFWQTHMRGYNSYNDYDIAFPIRRLIDWAWTPGVSSKIDTETARLTAQALLWLLASTDRKLRDETTKALVNVLEQQPKALLLILRKSEKINDPYILERLYAAAYGCILRTEDNRSVIEIAKVIYTLIFKNGNPPNHILLRDYARNAIEYAVYKNPNIEIDLSLIRPPYKSKIPEYFPSSEEIQKFRLDTDSSEFKRNSGRMNNLISYSILNSDFGRYIIDNGLENFHPVPFTLETEYKEFLISLKPKQRKITKILDDLAKYQSLLISRKNSYHRAIGKEKYEEKLRSIDEFRNVLLENPESLFDQDQISFIRDKALKYLESKHSKNSRLEKRFDTEPYKNWIINRVFELGYDYKIHGDYDIISNSHNDRSENKIERIGKKYQWIAFHEIAAMISDNHKVYANWSDKLAYYEGAWQVCWRDIDPVFTKKIEEESEEEDIYISPEIINWYDDPNYSNWKQDDNDWINNLVDLPKIAEVLEKKDGNSNDWLSLKKTVTWKELKSVGQNEYQRRRKQVFYKIQGYLIKKKDKNRIVNWLNAQNFWGNWMPENSTELQLMNREKYWSPAYIDMYEKKEWESIQKSRFKVIIATDNAVGEMSEDKSGAHFYYDMPCKTLFEGMQLNYAPSDGDFTNNKGDLIVQSINYKSLFKKAELLKYLEENDLELIWILIGEKMSYDSSNRGQTYFKKLSGVFYLEGNKIVGNIRSFNGD